MDLEALMLDCRNIARDHGWEADCRSRPELFSEKMLLIISEIIEALEEYRNNHIISEIYKHLYNPDKPEGVPIELADAIIRILDFCAANEIDIVRALELKMEYNKTRPYRHGNKRA